MRFRPLGDQFDIRTAVPQSEFVASINDAKRPMFDMISGPRGWIAAGIVCLWMEPFNRYGPMLLGHITTDGMGTRVRGRAGSDLNGVLYFLFLAAVLIPFLPSAWAEGGRPFWTLIGIIFAGVPLILWFGHRDRHEAEPLIRFVSRLAAMPFAGDQSTAIPMSLTVNDEAAESPVTTATLDSALAELGRGGTVVLGKADDEYVQALMLGSAFLVEKREGSADAHFEAVSADGRTELSYAEARMLIFAYANGQPTPTGLSWEPKHVGIPLNIFSNFR